MHFLLLLKHVCHMAPDQPYCYISVPSREGRAGGEGVPSAAAKEKYMQCMHAGHGGNSLLEVDLALSVF